MHTVKKKKNIITPFIHWNENQCRINERQSNSTQKISKTKKKKIKIKKSTIQFFIDKCYH